MKGVLQHYQTSILGALNLLLGLAVCLATARGILHGDQMYVIGAGLITAGATGLRSADASQVPPEK